MKVACLRKRQNRTQMDYTQLAIVGLKKNTTLNLFSNSDYEKFYLLGQNARLLWRLAKI